MVRITVQDVEKNVSFEGDVELAHLMVAACAADPQLLEDLLVAVETFRPGTVAGVMHQLLRFDAGVRSQYTVAMVQAFEVSDDATARMANRPDADGLVIFDLAEHVIKGQLYVGEVIASRGAVRVKAPTFDLQRETVYALAPTWRVDVRNVPSLQTKTVGYA